MVSMNDLGNEVPAASGGVVELEPPKKLYVHFVWAREDAESIVKERKLRGSTYPNRRGMVCAVSLDSTQRDDRVQLRDRGWGVLFTTVYEDEEGEYRNEVFWHCPEKDEKGWYLPLDMAVVINLNDTLKVRDILEQKSPKWD
jgi:hypothetical protein